MTAGEPTDPDDASRRRLAEVEQELRRLSPGWGPGLPLLIGQQAKLDALQDEQRRLRGRLGLPQITSPPRPTTAGWIILSVFVTVLFGAAWLASLL